MVENEATIGSVTREIQPAIVMNVHVCKPNKGILIMCSFGPHYYIFHSFPEACGFQRTRI